MWYYYLSILLFIVSAIISFSVKHLFNKYSDEYVSSGLSGAEAAYRILQSQGITDVRINAISGTLTDNYDPTNKVLNLSSDVYNSRSVSAVAVAAHECGHAIQDYEHYTLLNLRKSIVPITNISSRLSYIAILLGIIMEMSGLVTFGAILFSAIVIFNLITLPVEVDASSRAMALTRELGIFTDEDEYQDGKKVLIAAGLTYFIALLSSILQLVRLLSMANSSKRRDK
jgi:uncharacterized protein